MKTLNVSEVRKALPTLIDEVATDHQEVVITRHGKPVAKLVPFDDDFSHDDLYTLRGLDIRIADDFDEPSSDLWQALQQ